MLGSRGSEIMDEPLGFSRESLFSRFARLSGTPPSWSSFASDPRIPGSWPSLPSGSTVDESRNDEPVTSQSANRGEQALADMYPTAMAKFAADGPTTSIFSHAYSTDVDDHRRLHQFQRNLWNCSSFRTPSPSYLDYASSQSDMQRGRANHNAVFNHDYMAGYATICAVCNRTPGCISPTPMADSSSNPAVAAQVCHKCYKDSVKTLAMLRTHASMTKSQVEEERSEPPSFLGADTPKRLDSNNPYILNRVDSHDPTGPDTSLRDIPEASRLTLNGSSTRTCVSCTDELPPSDFPQSPLTLSCTHENSACKTCIGQWIDTQLSDQSWNEIKCLECKELMQYPDIQRHAEPEVFERYDQLAARSVLNNEPNFVWCTNRGCGFGQVHEGGKDMPLFQCKACRYRFCIVHGEPWHEGETCKAFDRRMNGEEPLDEGEDMDERTARVFKAEGLRIDIPTLSEIRDVPKKTSTSDAQLAMDYDAALALQASFAKNKWPIEESGEGDWRDEPLEKSPEKPTVHDSAPNSPMQATMKGTGFVNRWFKRKSEEYPTVDHVVDSNIVQARTVQMVSDQSLAQALHQQYIEAEKERKGISEKKAEQHRAATEALERAARQQSDKDAAVARALHRADKEREATSEKKAKQQREVGEALERAARRQSYRDAAAARALHEKLEREEREQQQMAHQNRQRQRREGQQREQATRERKAYQRRKAQEKEGEQTVRTVSKQCPKCQWSIQLSSGCDHVSTSAALLVLLVSC